MTKDSNWVRSRIDRATGALDRAFAENLTGHTVAAREGKRVVLTDGTPATEFVSCSYLGLETHPALIDAARQALARFGVHLSASRNRMRPPYLAELEELLATIYGGRPALVFTSVSNVHLGLLPLLGAGALPGYPVSDHGMAFIIERTAHASMQVLRGLLAQVGPVSRFDIGDPASLPACLTAAGRRTPVVLTDGVGSMGGLVDVRGIYSELESCGGYLYIDDAHGISVSGANGAGYAAQAFGGHLPDRVILVGSLSKAFGGSGGFAVLHDNGDATVARKFANPLVFGHSIMLPMLAADVAAARLHLGPELTALQRRLWRNTELFDQLTDGRLDNAGLASPVRGLPTETEEQTFAVAHRLRAAGVLILPAFFPTVAKGTGLIRFALSSLHSEDDLRLAASVIREADVVRERTWAAAEVST